jgi:hypothetical protein
MLERPAARLFGILIVVLVGVASDYGLGCHPAALARFGLPSTIASHTGVVCRCQRWPRTIRRAASASASSSVVNRPAGLPSRFESAAASWSTSSSVGCPSTSMRGRNESGSALIDVGATSQVESSAS